VPICAKGQTLKTIVVAIEEKITMAAGQLIGVNWRPNSRQTRLVHTCVVF